MQPSASHCLHVACIAVTAANVVLLTGRAGERSDQTRQHVQVFAHSRHRPGNNTNDNN